MEVIMAEFSIPAENENLKLHESNQRKLKELDENLKKSTHHAEVHTECFANGDYSNRIIFSCANNSDYVFLDFGNYCKISMTRNKFEQFVDDMMKYKNDAVSPKSAYTPDNSKQLLQG